MQQQIKNIEQWAEDRNLINGSTPQKQMLKLMEEFGKLCSGIARNNPEMIKDAIGDCFVVLVILNKQYKTELDIVSTLKHHGEGIENVGGDVFISVSQFAGRAGNLLYSNYCSNNERCLWITGLFCSLLLISSKCHLNLQDCVTHAYNQIKDRKGKMVDGVFVKEEDL